MDFLASSDTPLDVGGGGGGYRVVMLAATVSGAVVAAPAPARPQPGRLAAPRQATLAAVALMEAEGRLHTRP